MEVGGGEREVERFLMQHFFLMVVWIEDCDWGGWMVF
jgi:hypothetical protein